MANRREFLQSAAALSAAPLTSRAFSKGRESVALDAVIYDLRYPQACEFGAFAAGLGAPVRSIEGDITNLWKRELLGRWKTAADPLVGLTERPALFLLERLAWDYGLRVVFEAEHELGINGQVRHRVVRSADASLAAELEAARAGWTGVLADALVAGRQAPMRNFYPTDAAMAARFGEATKLYSWIIAPRAAVLG